MLMLVILLISQMISSSINGQFWIRMSCNVQYDQTFCSLVKNLAFTNGFLHKTDRLHI